MTFWECLPFHHLFSQKGFLCARFLMSLKMDLALNIWTPSDNCCKSWVPGFELPFPGATEKAVFLRNLFGVNMLNKPIEQGMLEVSFCVPFHWFSWIITLRQLHLKTLLPSLSHHTHTWDMYDFNPWNSACPQTIYFWSVVEVPL